MQLIEREMPATCRALLCSRMKWSVPTIISHSDICSMLQGERGSEICSVGIDRRYWAHNEEECG